MNKMSPKVKKVTILKDYKLLLKFENNENKVFDVTPYLEYEVFKPLVSLDEFKKIYVDFGTVCWKCGADLSRDTLYLKSYENDKTIQM